MAGDRKELILVDGSGYIFRAFFALPQLNTSRGMPTNAVYGFIRMLLKLLKDTRPTHIAVVFDSAKKTFRDDLFEDYKANRAEMPSDLNVQIPYVHRAVEAFRIKSIIRDGYEADDVIATLATRAARKSFDTIIVTSDKDLRQLVGPHVTLWDTMSDRRTGVREVKERFGVEPAALADIQALTGDPIDNVKGVPGIGEKTASALVQRFGALPKIFASLADVGKSDLRGAKKIADLLRQHRAEAELALKLVRIDTHVPLDVEPDDLAWEGIDSQAAADLVRELEFHSLLAELTASAAAREARAAGEVAVRRDDLRAALDELASAERISLDLTGEDGAGDRLQLRGGGLTYVVTGDLIGDCASLLNSPSPPKTCHDLKTHLRRLARHAVALKGVDFDTMLAGFLVNPGRAEPSLDDLYHEHLAPVGGSAGGGTRAEIAGALREVLLARMRQDGLERLFAEIEIPVAYLLAEMEATGIGIDAAALKKISAELGEQAARLEQECYELAGRRFNLNSPAQLREVLFTHLKLSAKGLKKTKSGFSTDADTLEKLAPAHPMPQKLLEYRALAKLKSTYADALGELIDPATGRIHTTFHQALTATGRLSSSDPNLQNIPTRNEEGRRIRRAFVARDGCLLLSADYSQIDLRVLAHLSGDPTLVDAFQRGEDIHVRTATEVLGITADRVDAAARRLAKTINFGIIYGMGPQRLASQLGISIADASDYIKRYFERLPGVQAWVDETVKKARADGYVTTMYGRRRYLPELNSPPGGARAQAERIAINTPIQGTAADLIKVAMIRLHNEIRRLEIPASTIMQVHDELLLEVQADAVAAAGDAARREMQGVASLKVPLRVDVKWGPNWAEMGGGS